MTCHGLRHTHASMLLFKGVNVKYVSQRLGHKDIVTTL
nr:tyrosine-type recombinase/integrase [Geobacillus kaustophilus]